MQRCGWGGKPTKHGEGALRRSLAQGTVSRGNAATPWPPPGRAESREQTLEPETHRNVRHRNAGLHESTLQRSQN